MDENSNGVAVLRSQRRGDLGRLLVDGGQWQVYELELTLEKTKWLWEQMQRYRTLFSDFTRGDVQNFYDLISLRDSYWAEVVDEQGQTVGMIYWTGMSKIIDADVHLMFFDRKPAEKVALCKDVAKWFFGEFPQYHRMTATLPIIYHATIRLAGHIGFRREGRKRQSQMMGGKKVDELIFGLLSSEIQ